MKKVVIWLLVAAVVGAAGYWAYQRYVVKANEPQQEQEEATVAPGSLTSMVNATGTILPEKQTTLAFRSPGLVVEVMAVEGQAVAAGQVLARLDTTDLEFAIKQAELGLASAQAQLVRLQRPPSEYDIAAAQAALDSAQAAYERLVAGPSPEETQVARLNVDQAKAALDQAQAAYGLVADRPDISMLPQSLQLQQATIAYEAAKASFALTQRKASTAELASAQAGISQAEAGLARLQQGIAEEDLLASQLQVQQAQLSLDQAQHQLDGAQLAAPHAGTITLVGIKAGELTAGQPAFVLTDLSQYHIDISVDEVDVGRIATGQPVTVTLDALPGEVLTGKVERVADTSLLDAGVVIYRVSIRLDPTGAPLRAGMTANADVLTERRDNVLLVPNRFVRVDRTTGKTFVDRLVGAEVQPLEIQIGLRDEVKSEVLAGLKQGDVVVLIKVSSRDQLRSAFQMGGP